MFAPLRSLPLLLACCTLVSTRADEPAGPDRFAQRLAAGEFSLALDAAQQIVDSDQRDARLSEIAAAQAKAGARENAYTTLAAVRDDRVRSEAIARMKPAMPGRPGGAEADFESLIDLITTTVRPTTWDDVGGPGSISEFRNGVYVDAAGVLKRVLDPKATPGLAVARLAALDARANVDPRGYSPLRKVSLTRLEKHVQLALAQGRLPDDDMRHLAGLEKIQYVLVYPESGDLVLAGPAGPWRVDDEGLPVSQKSGRPVVHLDDLVVLLRFLGDKPGATFGCSIEPTTEGLARTRQFAEQSSAKPLKPGQRSAWLKKLREQLGRQEIVVDGIDPRTRVARVLVEADYRMKLVGMGLEEGTIDVPSYLELLRVPKGEAPPPLEVLRWWFTLRYDAVRTSEDRNAFEIVGPGAQVLSENEMLTALGQRVHTGASQPTNREFAERFTRHFAALAEKYPVYADLQNMFDLALVAALVRCEGLADRVGWHLKCFGDPRQYQPALGRAPQAVDSVINHRSINGRHLVVGVSGGVHVRPWKFVAGEAIVTDHYGKLDAQQHNAAPDAALPLEAWWWD